MPRAAKTQKPVSKIVVASLAADLPPGVFVGTSGWAYSTWKPGFYPEGLAAKRFLSFYASQMNSVEVNSTFRALPTAKMLADWLAATPEGFRFSFKAPQRITHFQRLRECKADLTQLIEALRPVQNAGKLGLLLFQLPPNFKADGKRLRDFLASPSLLAASMPVAFEFRHESWFTPEIEQLLRDHNAALCVAESDDLVTPTIHPAATHTSFRLRRNGGYSPAEILAFATQFRTLSADRMVYIYFKHEGEPTGALNAVDLVKALWADR